MKAYKLTTTENQSVSVEGKFLITYEVGKKTLPTIPGSKLFVFKTKEHALEYASDSDFYKLWECETSDLIRMRYRGYASYPEEFWVNKQPDWKIFLSKLIPLTKSSYNEYYGAPSNTYGADWVILIKEVPIS